ncbi:MAG: hypothetical protein WA322_07925 [Pseudolabrys sp.]
MKRRKFIAFVGGAVAMPLVARAQQNERIRRIGVLTTFAKENPEGQARIAAFLKNCRNWVGPRVAIYRSSIDGIPVICGKLQRNW